MSANDINKARGKNAALAMVKNLQKAHDEEKEKFKKEPVQILGVDELTKALVSAVSERSDLSAFAYAIEQAIHSLEIVAEAPDVKSIVDAINAVDPTVNFDASIIVDARKGLSLSVDLEPLKLELSGIREAIEENSIAMRKLVDMAGASKKVIYDDTGRVSEIKVIS